MTGTPTAASSDLLRPVLSSEEAEAFSGRPALTEAERFARIAATIAEIRPVIRADGGDLELVAVRGRRVEVRLTGACLSCALAGQTLGGIRRRLMAVLDVPVMVVPLIG